MSGFTRYIAILRLFTEQDSDWTVQGMAGRLGVPASTVYRAVRELQADGFLTPSNDAHYRLGAAFVAFDRITRLSDPLVAAGTPLLQDMVRQANLPCVGLLCRLYEDTVMCVADAVQGVPAFRSSYERGRRMPLGLGATSKIILAQLPARRLAHLLAREQLQDDAALRASLSAMRKRGYTVSRGEIDRGAAGLAASLVLPGPANVASLSLVVDQAALDAGTEQRLTLLLVACAGLLTDALRPADAAADRPSVPACAPVAKAATL